MEVTYAKFIREYRRTPVGAIYVNTIDHEAFVFAEFEGGLQHSFKFASKDVLWDQLMAKHYLQGVTLYANGVEYTIGYKVQPYWRK